MSEVLPAVTEVIAERIKSGNNQDGYRVGLVLQGGAMRGVISAGAVNALEALIGENEPFDQTDDTSAGAYCWSYLASRNTVEGATIFYEDLTKGFMGYRNFRKIGHLIDPSIINRVVSAGPKALDFDRITTHPTEQNFYATSVNDAKPVKFQIGQRQAEEPDSGSYSFVCPDAESVKLALEASSHLPWYSGDPVAFGENMLLVDGGLSAGRLPLDYAINAGCTHIFVVSTDKKTAPEKYKRKAYERFGAARFTKDYPYLGQNYWSGFKKHIEVMKLIGRIEAGDLLEPRVEVIRSADKFIPSSVERNPRKLYIAAQAGRQAVLEVFKPYGLKIDQSLGLRLPRLATSP